MRNTGVCLAAVATAVVAAVTLHARQDDKIVPVHQEPRHHLVFDSAAVRILDIQIPPGDTTLFHTHSDPILYVNMSSSQTRSQVLGKDWSGGGGDAAARPPASAAPAAAPSPAPAPAGRPAAVFGRMNSVTTYPAQPLTHRVNNVGTTVFRLIGIINRSGGDERPEASADFPAKPELDNRWFRGYRWVLDSDVIVQHHHANPVAIVLVAGRAVVAVGKDTTLDTPGSFVVVDAGAAHTVRRVGPVVKDVPMDQVVEIEIRRPPS